MPRPPATAEAWQISNPPILAMSPVRTSLEIFDKVGIDALRERSVRLTAFLESLLESVLEGGPAELVTPREPERRGAQLSVRIAGSVAGAADVARRLRFEHGVIVDVRRPDIVRLAPAPLYSTYHDCWRAAEALRRGHRHVTAVSADVGDDVAVIGGGLAGCLLACFLGRRGLTVRVYERRPDPRAGQAERGRSINLAISERGLDALRRIGLADQVMADALPMRGRMIHPVQGPLDFQPYSAGGDLAINSISRAALNHALLDAAEAAAGVEIVFDHQLVELDPAAGDDGVRDRRAARFAPVPMS